MGILDVDKLLGQEPDPLAAAAVNLTQAAGQNPQEHIERRKLSNASGVPAALMDDPEVRERARRDAFARELYLREHPATAGFAANPNNAPLITDDIVNLKDFEDKTRTLAGTASDVGLFALKGATAMPQAFVGLADIPTFGRIGKALEYIGYKPGEAQDILGGLYSPAQKEANRKVAEAKGVIGKAVAAVQNPSVIAQTVIESLPSMIGGAGLARGGMAGAAKLAPKLATKLTPALAAALGEGAISAGGAAEQIRGENEDGLLTLRQAAAALASGGTTAAFSILGGKVAEKLGIADVDVLLTGKGASAGTKKALGRRVLEGMAAEGILEELPQSATEQMWQNTATGKPVFQGVDQAIVLGAFAGMAMGGGSNIVTRTAKAEQENTALLDTLTAAEASRLKAGLPESFAEFAQRAGDQHGLSAIHLQADKAVEVALGQGLTVEQIMPWLEQYGATAEALDTAIQTGGTIALDYGKVAAGFSNDPTLQALKEDFMVSPSSVSKAMAAEAEQVEEAHLEKLNDLFAKEQGLKIGQEDVQAWTDALLATPGLEGRVTPESLSLLTARANALTALTGQPAIGHLNRMLGPTGLTTMKLKDFRELYGSAGEEIGQPQELGQAGQGINPEAYEAENPALDRSPEINRIRMEKTRATRSWADIKGLPPEKMVRVYRAVPDDGPAKLGISPGDFVATGKYVASAYASDILRRGKATSTRIVSKLVPAGQIRLHPNHQAQGVEDEFIYNPEAGGTAALAQSDRPFDGPDIAATPLPEGATTIEVDGVERPALNSEGRAIHPTVEGVKNFWRWFGDSKVVDSEGRPLVVYHGGASGITAFDPAKIGERFGYDTQGFFFTLDNTDALGGAKDYAGDNGEVYSVYLSIPNPYTLDDYIKDIGDTKRNLMYYGGEQQPLISVFDDDREAIIDFANKSGKDGIVFEFTGEDGTKDGLYVAFAPTQIKSAIGNRGTFDPAAPSILMQSAWHGSPHTFDKFSTSAIGTGEGAQAYGYGLYMASSRGVAEYYRESLTDAKFDFDEFPADVLGYWNKYRSELMGLRVENGALVGSKKTVLRLRERAARAADKARVFEQYGDTEAQKAEGRKLRTEEDELLSLAEFVKSGAPLRLRPGRLYKVELAPEEDEYLLWDKPLSEQSEKVKAALGSADLYQENTYPTIEQTDSGKTWWIKSPGGWEPAGAPRFRSAEKAQAWLDKNGEEYAHKPTGQLLYLGQKSKLLSDKAASEYLHSLGIRGIKYLDGPSRGAGEGNYNYVIFSDDDVAITEMYQRQNAKIPQWLASANELNDSERQAFSDALVKFFGKTKDPFEAGYILPDGTMLDLSGRHYAADHPSFRGQRQVDHRELFGENKHGFSIENFFPEGLTGGSDAMAYVMAATGAMRVDMRSGVASVTGDPSQKQIAIIGKALKGEYAYLTRVNPETGYISAEGEVDRVTPLAVKRFFDEAKNAPDTGAMYQRQTNDPLGVLAIMGDRNLVNLFEKADKSTFLHETAHIFLNDLKFVAETLGVQTTEWETAKTWLGIGEDGVITRAQHERFAEHFEVYLKNGEAPVPELRSAFRAFKRWLTAIYDNIKASRYGQRAGITISPEIANLFDHLLATDQEIRAAREQAALVALLDDEMLKELSASPEQVDEYRNLSTQADDAAREKRDIHKLKDREELRKEWRKQAEAESFDQPVYGFIQTISKLGGINKQSAIDAFGAENLPDHSTLWRTKGDDINVAIAEHGAEFGYQAPADFVEQLRNLKPRNVWVEQRIAQLETLHDNAQDTQEVIRSTAMRRMLDIESVMLSKKTPGAQAIPAAAIKVWAAKTIAGRTIKQINMGLAPLQAQSRRLRQMAILAVRDGRWEDALRFNEQARRTEGLISASMRASKEWTKTKARWKRIAKWTNDNKNVKLGTAFRDQINRLLDQYEIASREYDDAAPDLQSFVALRATGNPLESDGVVLAEWLGVQIGSHANMSWERLQDLDDALKFLYGNGREELEGQRTAKGEFVKEIAGSIANSMNSLKPKRELWSDATAAGRAARAVQQKYRKFMAHTGILRFICQRMDGYAKHGLAQQQNQEILNGMARENDLWTGFSAKLEPLITRLTKDGGKVFTDLARPAAFIEHGVNLQWTKKRVVCACLNMGNASNLQRLRDGFALSDTDLHALAGKLTASEWQDIQAIWDTINEMWPMIADVHERINHFRPKKIEPQRLRIGTADGQSVSLPGGYYPVGYDISLLGNYDLARWSESDDILNSNENTLQVPVAKSGMTKARADKVARPLSLSFDVLGKHLHDSLRYIALAEAVRDTDRIFNNKELRAAAYDTIGSDLYGMIRPTLMQILRPNQTELGRYEWLRTKTSVFYMAWNTWTAVQNITGVFPAMFHAGVGNYVSGMAHVASEPYQAYKTMLEMSGYMRLRDGNMERDMQSQLKQLASGGLTWKEVEEKFADAGFLGIRAIDTLVSLPAWWGVYNDQMRQHGDAQSAIEAADTAINNALGSGLAIDQTGIGRSFWRLLEPFMSFASTQQEVLRTEKEALMQGKIAAAEYLHACLMVWIFPSLASTFLSGLMMYGLIGAVGGGDDDDKRKKTVGDYFTDAISYRLMGLPFVRDAWNAYLQGAEHKQPITAARMPFTEFIKMGQQAFYRVGALDGDSEKSQKALAWTLAEMVSFSSGLPVTRVYDKWQKGQEDIENREGWWMNHLVPQERKK